MTIWFSADFHLNHDNILRFCSRPYDTIGEMDEAIICNWNARIRPNDTAYILGDFCFGDPRKFYDRLNGKVYIIPGSHDKELNKIPEEFILPPIYTLKLDPPITLCHYAMRSWYKSHYASWHLFGHHHGKLEPYGLSFDVGVDCWDYYPVSLDEVAEKMATLKPIVDFRKSAVKSI
jgi:calcineurin-like phosphoesterase family protein